MRAWHGRARAMVAGIGLVAILVFGGHAVAQEAQPIAPDVAPSLGAIHDAFRSVADQATAATWPAADAAFNDALAALDQHRPTLELVLGAAATPTSAPTSRSPSR